MALVYTAPAPRQVLDTRWKFRRERRLLFLEMHAGGSPIHVMIESCYMAVGTMKSAHMKNSHLLQQYHNITGL
jgi:hypothetical protein